MASEIELRARIAKDGFEELKAELDRSGFVANQVRCFIDYSTFLEGIGNRKLDVRVRVTDSVPEFVVKSGEFGGAVREEAVARIIPADLEGALSVMALLGYEKGVAGGRRICRGVIGEVEVALQEVMDFQRPQEVVDRFVEVEYVGGSATTAEAEALLRKFLADRGISPFAVEEWNEFVKHLNEKWNGVYEHGVTEPDIIRALGS